MVTRAAALLSQISSRTSSTAQTSAAQFRQHFAPISSSARSQILSSYRQRRLSTNACSVSTDDRAQDVVEHAALVLEEASTDEVAVEASTNEPVPATAEAEAEAVAAESGAAETGHNPKDALLSQFHELWTQYTDVLTKKGFFDDTPGMTVSNTERSEIGVIKRANLQAARDRIDLLYSLPTEKLVALSSVDLPYVDRKVSPCACIPCLPF